MSRLVRSLTAWLLIASMSATPLWPAVGSTTPLSLLEVQGQKASEAPPLSTPAAPVLGVPRVPAPPSAKPVDEPGPWPWIKKFGAGVVDGFVHALPNVIRSFQEDPLKTTLMVGGLVGLGFLCPPAALAIGAGLTGWSLWQAGGDPTRTGQVIGETAFWGAAGVAGARAIKSLKGAPNSPPPAPRAATPANGPLTTPMPRNPIRPGQKFDTVTGNPLQPGQRWNGQRFDTQTGKPLTVPAHEVVPVPAGKERLVVGGGRATEYGTHKAPMPALEPSDLSLNIDPLAMPDVLGDAGAMKFPSQSFREVFFECIPKDVLTSNNGAALRETLRVLKPGGKVSILTGGRADGYAIRAMMESMGYKDVLAQPTIMNRLVQRWRIEGVR